jgi:hypothetical protein
MGLPEIVTEAVNVDNTFENEKIKSEKKSNSRSIFLECGFPP